MIHFNHKYNELKCELHNRAVMCCINFSAYIVVILMLAIDEASKSSISDTETIPELIYSKLSVQLKHSYYTHCALTL